MRLALALSPLFAGTAAAHEHAAAGHEHAPGAPVAVQQTADGAVYGAVLPETPPEAVPMDLAASSPAAHIGKAGAYSGRITSVCQAQGCWLVLSGEQGEFARVLMHGHGFSVPKNARGEAVVYGTLSEKQRSAEELAHLAKDGAKEPAARELEIDATSVVIRNAG
jgi:hypothetical protein